MTDFIKLTKEPLSVEEASNQASDVSCGAISLFVGTTRDHFDGQKVLQLEYEAYEEMAQKEMKKLCIEARKRFNVNKIVIYHRLGVVDVKEASIILAVSSVHRRESLDAVSFLIDALKASVPIWKKEVYDDGTSNWKQNKECAWNTEKAKMDSMCSTEEEGTQDSLDSNNQIESDSLPEAVEEPDRDFIQIHASKEELERRISAFQKRKREELNILNIQEFCMPGSEDQDETSCARTSAVILRSKNSASHLKFTKVTNHWGPLTDFFHQNEAKDNFENEGKKIKTEPDEDANNSPFRDDTCFKRVGKKGVAHKAPTGIEERLKNMEEHLHFSQDSPVPPDVYKRIKDLEDRILYLESLSPEYFSDKKALLYTYPKKVSSWIRESDDLSLKDIDDQIFQMKTKLKRKQLGIQEF